MGAEQSNSRSDGDGREIFEGDLKLSTSAAAAAAQQRNAKKRNVLRHQNTTDSLKASSSNAANAAGSPTAIIHNDLSRVPSPPLSVCSDLPYVSYTQRPIGDSPKIRQKPQVSSATRAAQIAARKSHPSGTKPKRPQSTISSHSIVIVKPGAREFEHDSELLQLQSIPQFLPVLRETITSASFTRDPEILERLHSQHLTNICSRMQSHLNLCAATHSS